MKKILLFLLFIPSFAIAQGAFEVVDGWNACVYLPKSYNPAKQYPGIYFIPGIGEVGSDKNRLVSNGPNAYIRQGWDGRALGIDFIVISLQPPYSWPNERDVMNRMIALKSKYNISHIFMTGLSMGGWASMWTAVTYPDQIKAIVSVEGVDIAYGYNRDSLWSRFANVGGKMLNFEQIGDYRLGDKAVESMNKFAPESAAYIETAFNGGGHCCWNEFYGGQGKQPGKFFLMNHTQNIYEWFAREYLTILPTFITKLFARNNVISWECDNIEEGDKFIISESDDGVNFKDIAIVSATPSKNQYQYTL